MVEVMQTMDEQGHATVECTPEAEAEWVEHSNALFPDSVWSLCDSWYNKRAHGKEGGTIEGYTGSFKTYMDDGIVAVGMDGLQFS